MYFFIYYGIFISSFGEIFREQAPELARIGDNEAEQRLMREVEGIPDSFILSGDISDFIDWFYIQVGLMLSGDITQIERERIRNKLFSIFNASQEYGMTKIGNNASGWENERQLFEENVGIKGKSTNIQEIDLEQDIQNTLVSKGYDITKLDLSTLDVIHLNELHRYIHSNFKPDYILLRDGINKTLWSVGKFGRAQPCYRIIFYQRKIIGIFSHLDYEAYFLEPAYKGRKIPRRFRGIFE